MKRGLKALGSIVIGSVVAAFAGPPLAAAQEPPPASGASVTQRSQGSAQAEAGEPRADTSAPAASPPTGTASAAAGGTPAPATPPGTGMPLIPGASHTSPPEPAAVPPSPASRTQRPAAAHAATPGAKATVADRIALGTATVTGDQEQPKVMYIVPWKKSDIGDLSGKPMNSLLDEALMPVDRDEFKREVIYYQAVKADASQNGAARAPTQQGEK
jgi:hypothetical protein